MSKKEEKLKFYLDYATEEDLKKESEKQILELTEEQKSEFIFNGQFLYILGRGHDFLRGFFTEYLTKTGIKARNYVSDVWSINGDLYDYKNHEFIKRPELIRNTEPINFNSISLPMVKSNFAKLLADDLVLVKPKSNIE